MPRMVITGGHGALARALRQEFVQAGWHVDAPGRHELDVTDEQARRRYFAERPLDLLVCAAGLTRDALLPRLSEQAWDEVFEVNFAGAAACAAHALAVMQEHAGGQVVFVGSRSALHPPAGQAAYAAAKAALLGRAADLARRHGVRGMRVNTVLPGFLETPMTQRLAESRRREVLRDHVLGRYNTCCRVARFVRFLHEEMPHTSGQVFSLDSRISP